MRRRRSRYPGINIPVLICLAGLGLLSVGLSLAGNRHAPEESVVILTAPSGGGGTGFEVITPSGKKYTLTNRHMCEAGATSAVVGDRTIPLQVLEIDKDSDLCLLSRIEGVPGAHVATQPPRNGDVVEIFGFGALLPLTHTAGVFVEVLHGPMMELMFGFAPGYVTATVLPGNSGSPVFNRAGEVVGVVFASGEVIAFRALIVPLEDVRKFLEPY